MDCYTSVIHHYGHKIPLPDVYIPDSTRSNDKLPQEAIVDEEVILSLLENSATFLPHSLTSHHSSLLGIVNLDLEKILN